MARTCLFCEETKLTNAHLLSRKLHEMLPADRDSTTWRSRNLYSSDPYKVRRMDLSARQLSVNRLCGTCNSQWMNDLEEATRDLVVALAKGESITLTKDQREDLAAWATVVVMLRCTMDTNAYPFRKSDLDHIRQTSRTSDRLRVWLLRGEERWDAALGMVYIAPLPGVETSPFANLARMEPSWLVPAAGEPQVLGTLWVGQMLIVVAHHFVAFEYAWAMSQISPSLHQLHPTSDTEFTWPAGEPVSRDDYMSTVYGGGG